MDNNYKSQLEITLENLENARKRDDDYLIENAEIEALLDYLDERDKKEVE